MPPVSRAVAVIEPSRLQFLERTFAEWLGVTGRGSEVAELESDAQGLLFWLHRAIFVEGRSVEAVRNDVLAMNGGARFIALSSGKGGVGKTTCAVNLAFAMAELGHRVLLVDADLGLANVHVFAGVCPSATIQDFVEHRLTLAETLEPVTENLQILAGGSGSASLASLDARRMNRLLRHLRALRDTVDVVLIDTGAGLAPQMLAFLAQAQEIVVVTTPNIAATLDAYGLIKVIHEQEFSAKVRLLVNQCADEEEAHTTLHRITACAGLHLGSAPSLLGFLTRDATIEQANQERRPFIHHPETAANAEALHTMARELTAHLRTSHPPSTQQLVPA